MNEDYEDVREVFKAMLIRIKDIAPILFFILTGWVGVCIQKVEPAPNLVASMTGEVTYIHFDCFEMVRATIFISVILLGFNMAVIAIDLHNRPLGNSLIGFDLMYNFGNVLGYITLMVLANKFTANCPIGDCSTYKTVVMVISGLMIAVYLVNAVVMLKRDKEINKTVVEAFGSLKGLR